MMTSSRKKSDVTRTCLGCRSKKEQKEMIRIVMGLDGEAVFDIDGRLPGRGAYVCPLPSCLRKLTSSSLSHFLKGRVSIPEFDSLRSRLADAYEGKVRSILSIGLKAGQVGIGSRAVEDALGRKRAFVLLLASDASSRTSRHLLRLAEGVPVRTLAGKERLGSWLARRSVASAAVLDRGIARRLSLVLDRLTSIENNSYYLI
jgi:predicted RNA-binding protein YlxR (DUF448 family)